MKKRTVLPGLLAVALTPPLTACGRDKMPEETSVPAPIQISTPVSTPTPTPAPATPERGDQAFVKIFTPGDGATALIASFILPPIQNTGACLAGTAINERYEAGRTSRMQEVEGVYEMAAVDCDMSRAVELPFYLTTQETTHQTTYTDEKVTNICRDLYVSSKGEAYPVVFPLSEQSDAVVGEKLDSTDFFTSADAVWARMMDALPDQQSKLATVMEQGTLTRDAITTVAQVDSFYCTVEGYMFRLRGGALLAMNSSLSAVLACNAVGDVSADG